MERNRYHRGGGGGGGGGVGEVNLLLQWGNRKRLRCVKIQKKDDATEKATTVLVDRRVVRADKDSTLLLTQPRVLRNSEAAAGLKATANGGGAVASSEKGGGGSSSGSDGTTVWPKLAIQLTNKEKEEDFMAFKGSKLPQRPKKRAKLVQKTINLVSPGSWMCDLTLERYEVREKKISKKQPRGLKAMGNMESDSE